MLLLLNLLGLAVQLVGIAAVWFGLRQVWEDIRRDEHFWDPAVLPVRAKWHWIRVKMFRQPPRVVSGRMDGMLPLPTASARGFVYPGPLDPSLAPTEAIAELDRRQREIIDTFQKADFALEDRLNTSTAQVNERCDQLAGGIRERDEDERVRAIRGLRMEVVGFALLTAGSLLQGIASVIGAFTGG